jgi:mono/diheme cytochrome c family protein
VRWTGRSDAQGRPYTVRLEPGHAAGSAIVARMSVRGAGEQMPPIGTQHVDDAGVAAVARWIDSLDPASCDSFMPCSTTP